MGQVTRHGPARSLRQLPPEAEGLAQSPRGHGSERLRMLAQARVTAACAPSAFPSAAFFFFLSQFVRYGVVSFVILYRDSEVTPAGDPQRDPFQLCGFGVEHWFF